MAVMLGESKHLGAREEILRCAQDDKVWRIAVFRALMLGDVLCATPALRALRSAHPRAHITLIGLPWSRALLGRSALIDAVLPFPGHPALPEQAAADDGALCDFFESARARRFDLALQLHGDGRVTNAIVGALGAQRVAGFVAADAQVPAEGVFVRWPAQGHEIERCLALTDALGSPRRGLELDFPLRDEDRERAARWVPARPYVVIHPGSQLPSRRWAVDRFARAADALARAGFMIVVTGTAGEAPLAALLRATCRDARPLDLVGRTDLWTLGALIEGAHLLVANDTGVSHVAAALGTPSVIVSSGGDAPRWAPLDARRHRVLWHDLPCRPCAHAVCPTQHECAAAIGVDEVLAAAFELLQLHSSDRWPLPPDACASSPGTSTATTSTT
jgi:ADP-heptose:LPS heptosyltransferase